MYAQWSSKVCTPTVEEDKNIYLCVGQLEKIDHIYDVYHLFEQTFVLSLFVFHYLFTC